MRRQTSSATSARAASCLSGGPETVTEDATPRIPEMVFELGVPILGICYGMQALAHQLGGRVQSSQKREFGHARIRLEAPSRLLSGLPTLVDGELDVWMSHGDKVVELPPGFVRIAATASAPIAAMACEARSIYAVQFHPEVTHTTDGAEIIRRFAREICGCTRPVDAAEHHRRRNRDRRADRSATKTSCSGCRAASIRASLPHCCRARSAIS